MKKKWIHSSKGPTKLPEKKATDLHPTGTGEKTKSGTVRYTNRRMAGVK